MALKHSKPNPLNYFKLRRVFYACPHFKYVTIQFKYMPELCSRINEWILANLNNRYYVGPLITLDNYGSVVYNTNIGFESPRDVSVFIMSCPYIHER